MAARMAMAAGLLAVAHVAHAFQRETISIATYDGPNAAVYVPDAIAGNAKTDQKLSLVLELSGRCQSGAAIERAMNFRDLVDSEHFVLVVPEARRNTRPCPTCGPPFFGGAGCQAWAASPACCANDGSRALNATTGQLARSSWEPRDDSTYLAELIQTASQRYGVDRQHVYVFGYSAGGFMAHRLACDNPKKIAAVFSLTGGGVIEEGLCSAFERSSKFTSPVAIVHAHPLRDAVFPAAGGTFDSITTPPANATVSAWATHNGCEGGVKRVEGLDLFNDGGMFRRRGNAEPVMDTERAIYDSCSDGGTTESWSIPQGTHVGVISQNKPELTEAVVQFFKANPKPVDLLPKSRRSPS